MDIQELIKQKYRELPEDTRAAIQNGDLQTKFNAIADRHGLHVDQSGSLQTATLMVMLGIEDGDAYIGNIRKELDVSQNEAESIAQDVNEQIFKGIRTSLRTMEESEEQLEEEKIQNIDVSSIETAGQFTLEKPEPVASSTQYNESSLNKESILKGIEGSQEPMVDHLLKAPVVAPQKIETKAPESIPVEKTKPYTADPYREAI